MQDKIDRDAAIVEQTFGEEVAEAFRDMLRGLKNGGEGLVIAAIYLIPLWIIGGVIAVVVVVLVKRRKRKAPKMVPPYYPPAQPPVDNTQPKK